MHTTCWPVTYILTEYAFVKKGDIVSACYHGDPG